MHKLIRIEDVIARTSLCRGSIYQLIAKSDFPKPVKPTGGKRAAWVEAEVDAFIESRMAEREAA